MADLEADDTDLPADYVIVGIDIGFTCTGVAISSLDRVTDSNLPMKPFAIQSWPGATATSKTTNKVPTSITYRAGDHRVHFWGFSCPAPTQPQRSSIVVKRYFKFLLDQEKLDEVNNLLSDQEKWDIENIQMWFTDYLKKLREHIVSYLQDTQAQTLGESRRRPVQWGSTKVEYHFSLPTSWRDNADLIEVFRGVIQMAGFDSTENTSINIELTEGIASAVYTAKLPGRGFQKDDLLIVCDAGGATTDICVLKVDKIDEKTTELTTVEQLCPYAGSVQIDEDFEALYNARSDILLHSMATLGTPHRASQDLEHSEAKKNAAMQKFEELKLGWGTNSGARIPGLSYPFNSPVLLDSDDMRVEVLCEEIDAMFDKQIVKIVEQLEKALEYVETLVGSSVKPPIVLTGGLGSSAYLQSELRKHYNKREIKILVDEDPEESPLSVCKGLVYDRMQRLIHGTSVIPIRRCYASYGIVQHVPYQKPHHGIRTIFGNPADRRNHATGTIKWFIKYGEEIPEDFPIKIDQIHISSIDDPDTEWDDVIVMSKQPPGALLPKYAHEKECQVACIVTSISQSNPLPYERKYTMIGRRYLQVAYKVVGKIERHHLSFSTMVNEAPLGHNRTPRAPLGYSQD